MMVRKVLEERVKAYDDDGKLVGVMNREEAHSKRLITWTSQVIVHKTVEGQTLYLLTLRSPGLHRHFVDYWQIGYTETVDHDESEINAAARGGNEELGVDPAVTRQLLRHICNYRYRNPTDSYDKKNAAILDLDYNGRLKPNLSEIAKTIQVSFDQLEQMVATRLVGDKPLTGLSIEVWKIYKAEVLEGNGKNHRA